MKLTRFSYLRVKIESGIPVPSLRHKKVAKYRKIRRNSLMELLSKMEVEQSILLPIMREQKESFAVAIAKAQKRLGFRFTIRNYFTIIKDDYCGARVWRIA